MSRAFSLLVLIGFLVLVVTSSLARDLDDNASLLDSNLDEGFEDDEMLNIESLKRNRPGRQAPPPRSHSAPKNGRRRAPPPRHHATPPEFF
ncbi:hypothetical protein AAHA92_20266 [Salvia divinorum]|uniref:Uncharacterized protein n=1 Tax=Salvia divinorum TaxID=28513 RepID=A0ABD1GJX9_SALDI